MKSQDTDQEPRSQEAQDDRARGTSTSAASHVVQIIFNLCFIGVAGLQAVIGAYVHEAKNYSYRYLYIIILDI